MRRIGGVARGLRRGWVTLAGQSSATTVRAVLAVAVGTALVGAPAASAGTERPVAQFHYAPTSPRPGETVTFTSTSYARGDAEAIVLEEWDFSGTRTYSDATGTTVTHAFPAPGTYRVRLRVTDDNDNTSTTWRDVVVTDTPPVASFTVSPAAPKTGDPVNFSSTSFDPDGTVVRQQWDLSGSGTYADASGPTATRTFSTPGTYTIGLRVTDDSGSISTTSQTIVVAADKPPRASFGFSPRTPKTGDAVTFSSTSSDPDGTVVSQQWDLSGSGTYADASGPTATRTFSTSGPHTIGLRVTDDSGSTSTTSQTIVVAADKPPTAAFSFSPSAPKAGDSVTFSSTSSDPDGTVVSQQWDLSGSGTYTDASGPTATRRFPKSGSYTVGLRVRDDQGLVATVTKTIVVAPVDPGPGATNPPGSNPPTVGPPLVVNAVTHGVPFVSPGPGNSHPLPGLRWLSPYPLVHLQGYVKHRKTRIDRLTVIAPIGARVEVRCKGKGCPHGTLVRLARGRQASAALRFRALERGLSAGVVLEVFVTEPGMAGKYTRFRMRSARAPLRFDGCVPPGSRIPGACPTA